MQPVPFAPTVSVIIPALDEEANLRNAVQTVLDVIPNYATEFELLIFNDGSRDRTGEIAEELAVRCNRIRVSHHDTPKNLGTCYREGVLAARLNYVLMVPGDNECQKEVLSSVLSKMGTADIISPYPENPEARTWLRQFISKFFVFLLNSMSGQSLRYYNGCVLHKRHLLVKNLNLSPSFAYQAEILVRMLKKHHSVIEVPVTIHNRVGGKTKAFTLKNLFSTSQVFLNILSSRF